MLRLLLGGLGETHAAVASYNNHWGVPLTLARCPPGADFAVVEIGQRHRDGGPHQTPAVDAHPEPAQPQPGLLDVEELVGGDVDGHLLVVPDPAAGGARRLRDADDGIVLLGRGRPEQLVGRRQAHSSRQRASTSLASWR